MPISPYPCTWYENRFYKIFLATLIPWPYNLLWIPSVWWYRLYFGLILLLYITLPSRFSWWSSLPYALNPLNKITVPYKKHTNVGGSRLHKLRPTHRRLSLMEADTPHIKHDIPCHYHLLQIETNYNTQEYNYSHHWEEETMREPYRIKSLFGFFTKR